MRVSVLSSIAFATVKSQREEKQKSMISRQFSLFQIFQTFGNLEIDFSINLIKYV